jgi:C-terminal peptidase prc
MKKTKRFLIFAILLVTSLSCSLLTRGAAPATPTDTVAPAQTSSPVPPASGVYIPPQCQGQLVATLPPEFTSAQPTPTVESNPPLTTNEQLEVFEELASRISEVYLYPDFNGQDWNAITADYRARVENGMDTEAFYAAMTDFVDMLGDEHSYFESPAQVAESERELSGANDYVGIGVYVLPQIDKGQVSILSVFPDSSAEHGGLKPHDIVLMVDGASIVMDGVARTELVRGPECSAVVLTVQSPGESPRDVTFVRSRITTSLPIDARLVPTGDGSRIGYIFIPTFFDQTAPGNIRQALEDFGPLDGLILDNRMNGGGASTVMEPILSHFADGSLGQFVSRIEERPLEITADPVHNSLTVPLVILISEETVSFGEIFSGLLQDMGRAKLAGQGSLGNVETLHGYDFSDGSRVWLAEERFDPPISHANWERDGVQPDVQAHADWDTFTFENDPGIAAALELLEHGR